jgi:hypothetical protein
MRCVVLVHPLELVCTRVVRRILRRFFEVFVSGLQVVFRCDWLAVSEP